MINYSHISIDDCANMLQKMETKKLFQFMHDRERGSRHDRVEFVQSPTLSSVSEDMLLFLARKILFERRGDEASKAQNIILSFILNQWRVDGKLSFISNEDEKHEWLQLLDSALRDPAASVEHKVRCSLLLNKLYPPDEDNADGFVRDTLEDILNNIPSGSKLGLICSEMSQSDIEILSEIFFEQHKIRDKKIQKVADASLCAIAPYVLSDAFYNIIQLLVDKSCVSSSELGFMLSLVSAEDRRDVVELVLARFNDLFDIEFKILLLEAIVPYATQEQCDEIMLPYIASLDSNTYITIEYAIKALIVIAPYASQKMCDELISALVKKLSDLSGRVSIYAAKAIRSIAPRLSVEKCNATFDCLLNKVRATFVSNYKDIAFAASHLMAFVSSDRRDEGIKHFLRLSSRAYDLHKKVGISLLGNNASFISRDQCNLLIDPFIKALSDNDLMNATVLCSFGQIAARVSPENLHLIIPSVLNKLTDDCPSVRLAAMNAINGIVPYASSTECIEMINPVINGLADIDADVCESAAKALGAIALRVDSKECNLMIKPLVDTLHHECIHVQYAAASVICQFVPALRNKHLDTLLTLEGEKTPGLMAVQIIAKTRQQMNAVPLISESSSRKSFSFNV